MRLAERTLTVVQLAPRVCEAGELGGIAECFSRNCIPLRAAILPEEGGLEAGERGAVNRERLRLLVPADAGAAVGDGIWIAQALYRIAEVKRWAAHRELLCEAV